jgi:hypothetical protein
MELVDLWKAHSYLVLFGFMGSDRFTRAEFVEGYAQCLGWELMGDCVWCAHRPSSADVAKILREHDAATLEADLSAAQESAAGLFTSLKDLAEVGKGVSALGADDHAALVAARDSAAAVTQIITLVSIRFHLGVSND